MHLAIVLTFCIQAIHHRLNNVQFGFDGKIDEIGVDYNVVWWTKLRVVLEEQAGWVLCPAQKVKINQVKEPPTKSSSYGN